MARKMLEIFLIILLYDFTITALVYGNRAVSIISLIVMLLLTACIIGYALAKL